MKTFLAELGELWREVWAERRRMRLVVIGLVWGTLGLTLLLGFGEGLHIAMDSALRASGDRMLRLYGGATTRAHAGQPAGRSIPLLPADAAVIAAVPGVVRISAEYQQSARLLGRSGAAQNATVLGVDPEYAAVRGMTIAPGGRFLNAADATERRRVVVLGEALARALFGSPGDSVGRTVTIWDAPFVVVGALDLRVTMMNYGGFDDWKAIVPAPVLRAMRGARQVTYLLAECERPTESAQVLRSIRGALAVRKGFDADDRSAVGCQDHAAMARQIRAIVVGTRVFLLVVGVLGLLVAAIGVGNMMFVFVEERVPEIGLRLALGASPSQIRRRHLLETACVVAVGGGVGVLASALLLLLVNQIPMPADAKTYLGEPLLRAGTALGIAGMLGLCAGVAGWHPANRAAAVQPVEALRDE